MLNLQKVVARLALIAAAAVLAAPLAASGAPVYSSHELKDFDGNGTIDGFRVTLCDGAICQDRIWKVYGDLTAAAFSAATAADGFQVSVMDFSKPGSGADIADSEAEELAEAFTDSASNPTGFNLSSTWVWNPLALRFDYYLNSDEVGGISTYLSGVLLDSASLPALAFCDTEVADGTCLDGVPSVPTPGTGLLAVLGLLGATFASARRRTRAAR